MSRLITMLILAALFLAPLGCASMQAPKAEPFAEFPFRHDGYDLKSAWRTSPSQQGLVVEVALKNERYVSVDELELQVSLLTQGSKVIVEERALLPGSLRNDEYGNLVVVLKNASASPGDRLHFRLQYSATDGSTGYKWMSDFTVDALTGVRIPDKNER